MSNSASLNGGATLFFTTFTLVRLPTTSSPCLMAPMRRMSSRTEAVELERVAAGRGLGVAEHDADLHADLVDEDDDRVATCAMVAGQLAQRLRHEPRLQAHLRIAHLALDLGARHQRRHRVDDEHVDAPLRTSVSAISSACSPLSGCEISRSSVRTPSLRA